MANPAPSRLTMCCLSPLLNPDRDDEYYDLLGCDRRASAAQIKKLFRQKSIRMHPDKFAQRGEAMTPADVQAFQRTKEAYECLGDPKRRKIYDQLGELGLKLTENPASVPPETLIKALSKMSEQCRCCILLSAFALVAFFFLFFPVLLSLNVDGDADVPWAVVWLPLWVFDAFLVVNHVGWIYEGLVEAPAAGPVDEELGSGGPVGAEGGPDAPDGDDDEEEDDARAHDDTPVVARAFLLGQLLLVVAFQAALVWKLDGDSSRGAWLPVFAPLLPPCDDDSEPLDPNQSIEKELKTIAYVQQLEIRDRHRLALRSAALRVCLEVLLVCKLADAPKGAGAALNWWGVFAPLWVYCALQLNRCYRFAAASKAISATITPPPPGAEPGDDSHLTDADRVKGEAAFHAAASAAGAGCTCCCLLVVGVLVALKSLEYGFSAIVVFAPLLASVCCCYCCACWFVCGFRALDEDDDPGDEGEGEAHGDDEPTQRSAAGRAGAAADGHLAALRERRGAHARAAARGGGRARRRAASARASAARAAARQVEMGDLD
ncbi:hypothetical protein JL722_7112 [Aureococcus anophagefferens]|nr:hypothetical protein JL722_7112 [Aureococcus anophagefferens]